jgi:hypothetical protein
MLGSTRHSVGQLGCALLAAALHPEKDQTGSAGSDDQDQNHCDDDGGHNLPFRQSVDVLGGTYLGKELSYG